MSVLIATIIFLSYNISMDYTKSTLPHTKPKFSKDRVFKIHEEFLPELASRFTTFAIRNKGKHILLDIDSIGGDVMAMESIFRDMIDGKITYDTLCRVCYSAGLMVQLGAETRYFYEGSSVMFHFAFSPEDSIEHLTAKEKEKLKQYNIDHSIKMLYAMTKNITKEEIKAKATYSNGMRKDWYIKTDEITSLELGVIITKQEVKNLTEAHVQE